MFPGFVGIGAQKAGTTWLHAMLSSHQGIWLPRMKELHYFDRKYPTSEAEPRSASGRPSGILAKRLAARLRRTDWATLVHRLRKFRSQDLAWELKYHFGDWSDDWYASLFENCGGRLPGEITPAYSCLGDAAISHMRSLMPDVKLILLLRDPIDRAWSHARMDLAYFSGKRVDAIDQPRFADHFLSFASRRRGSYPEMLDRWLSHFPKEQLFVGFYDEIEQCPDELLARILHFLGVRATPESIPASVRDRVNAGEAARIPRALERQLAHMYVDDLRELAARYGSYPQKWLERCQRSLTGTAATEGRSA
jgi:hypothetical protein